MVTLSGISICIWLQSQGFLHKRATCPYTTANLEVLNHFVVSLSSLPGPSPLCHLPHNGVQHVALSLPARFHRGCDSGANPIVPNYGPNCHADQRNWWWACSAQP